MTDADLVRFIRNEISRQVNVLLHGQAGENNHETETIDNMYPGQASQTARPVMHPYGIVSRAPRGIIQITGRIGDHPGNRMVLGHRDKNRPTDLQEGETSVYSIGKYQVRVLNDKLQVGKDGDFETVVVGETLRDFLIAFIQLYVAHTHIGNLGYNTTVPQNAPQATELQTNNLDNDKILSKDGGRY
jgi:phage gp45-like